MGIQYAVFCDQEKNCENAPSPSLGELTLQAKQNIQAPWLGICAFFVFSIMLALLVFIFEGIRDAFDPRKVYINEK